MVQEVEEQSQILVNNLIVNNGAGGVSRQHARNQTQKGQSPGKNSDIMKLPTVSSNRNVSRAGAPTAQAPSSGGPARAGDDITINQVTPELAAQVVKYFVLPMFDTDAKKGLRRKYGRMQAATQYNAQQSHMSGQVQPSQGAAGSGGATVLGDLKLTEHLSNQFEELRQRFDTLQEELEKAALERNQYKKRFQQMNSKCQVQSKEIDRLKSQLELQIKINMGLESKMEQQLTQSTQLINMTLVSEEMRKLFSEQLRESLARDEANRNTIFNQSMSSQI